MDEVNATLAGLGHRCIKRESCGTGSFVSNDLSHETNPGSFSFFRVDQEALGFDNLSSHSRVFAFLGVAIANRSFRG